MHVWIIIAIVVAVVLLVLMAFKLTKKIVFWTIVTIVVLAATGGISYFAIF